MTRFHVFVFASLALAAAPAGAAIVVQPGWAVHAIPTPGTVQGGVVRRGDAILVGQGAFGAGQEQVIRLDADGATTIATGFNSLGGFDMDAGGTLYVVDNGGEQTGAATGDTVFAIPNALTATSAVTGAGHEVVAAGTIPSAMDVLALADGTLLVSDAAGAGTGRVVAVHPGPPASATDLISGLNFLGGLALDAGGTLLVGDVTFDQFFDADGSILRYTTAGAALGTLITGLSGAFAHDVDRDGNVLVSGGFTQDFSSSTIVSVSPQGAGTEFAHGFSFSGGVYFDAVRNELLVLDFGVSQITAICRDGDGDGVCDADDDCPAVADPAQADGDGDGIGDACDPCTGVAVAKAKVTIAKLLTPPGDDSLAFSGRVPLPPAVAAGLDPVTNGISVVVADATTTILDATLPGGAFDEGTGTGWKVKKGVFKYVSKTGAVAGVHAAKVAPSTRDPGLVVVAVNGRKSTYPADPSRLPLHATVVLDPTPGACGEARFPGPAPAPACVYDAAKGKVKCH